MPAVGATLTCSTGVWSNSPSGFAYQWTRDGLDIAGATASTYVVVTADAGKNVSCRVLATNADGSRSATAVSIGVAGGGAPAFTPTSLFTGGFKGLHLDPSAASAHYQTGTRAAPGTAAAAGDPLGLVLDQSGNNNDPVQATAAARLLRQTGAGLWWYLPDAVDDFLSVALDLSTTDKVTVFAAIQKQDDTTRMLTEFTANANSGSGTFNLDTGSDVVVGYNSLGRGTAAVATNQITTLVNSGVDTAMITVTHDIIGDLSAIRRNSVAGTNATGDKGAGNFANSTLYIASRGGASLFSNCKIYGLCVVGKVCSASEIANMETWLGAKAGLTL